MFSFCSLEKDLTAKNEYLLSVKTWPNENVTANVFLYIAFHMQWMSILT